MKIKYTHLTDKDIPWGLGERKTNIFHCTYTLFENNENHTPTSKFIIKIYRGGGNINVYVKDLLNNNISRAMIKNTLFSNDSIAVKEALEKIGYSIEFNYLVSKKVFFESLLLEIAKIHNINKPFVYYCG